MSVPVIEVLPSSARVGASAQPQPGYMPSQIASSAWKRAPSAWLKPMACREPQQSTWCRPKAQSAGPLQCLSKVGKDRVAPQHITTSMPASPGGGPPSPAQARAVQATAPSAVQEQVLQPSGEGKVSPGW